MALASGRIGLTPQRVRLTPLGRAACSGLVGGAETAAAEEEHGEPAGDPEGEAPVEVVGDVPWEVHAPSLVHRSGAHGVVLGEEEGSAGGKDSKLEDAHEQSAVDGADSPSVSPRANEHEQGVQTDQTEEGAHKGGEKGHLGALSLAVDVAIVNHGDPVIKVVSVNILVVVVDAVHVKVDSQVVHEVAIAIQLIDILVSRPVACTVIIVVSTASESTALAWLEVIGVRSDVSNLVSQLSCWANASRIDVSNMRSVDAGTSIVVDGAISHLLPFFESLRIVSDWVVSIESVASSVVR